MVTRDNTPTADEITALYDPFGDLSARLLGDNIHLGYWTGPDDDSSIQQATDRLTDIMIERLGVEPDQRVLDVGCGNGRPAMQLAQAKRVEVVGITNSAHHLELAAARAEGVVERVVFQLADAMELPFPERFFDAALAIESIPLMPDRLRALQEIARVLRPGGRLAIATMLLTAPVTGEQHVFLELV
jgi:ubiquinone/menaquinone biosynthesis C-methylase UbiE